MRILKLSLFTAFCIFTVNSCNNFALSTHDHGWFDGVIENEVDGRYHLLGTAKPGDALFTTPTPVTFWLEQSHTSLIKDSHPVGSDLKFYFHVLAFPTSGADAEVQIVTMD